MENDKSHNQPRQENHTYPSFHESNFIGWKPSVLDPLEIAVSDFPEITRVGLRRFDHYMYALASEAKAATLLYGVNDNPQTAPEIYHALEEILPAESWLPSAKAIRLSHLDGSLCPTGLVTRFKDDWHVYYQITEEGEQIGKDIAAYLLAYAVSTNISFKDYFGNIGSQTGSRAYINRSTILLHVLKGDSYAADIMHTNDLTPKVVGPNAQRLHDLGLVDYEAINTSEKQGWVSYRLVGDLDRVQHTSTKNRVRKNIAAYFRNNPIGNAQTIAEAIQRNDTSDITTILAELTGQGILERVDYQGAVRQSRAAITDSGIRFVEDFLFPVLKACSGDNAALSQIAAVSREVAENPALVANALRLYADASAGLNRRSYHQIEENILALIENEGASRYQEIMRTVGGGAGAVLKNLAASGRVIKTQDGKAVFYHLPDYQGHPTIQKQRTIYSYNAPSELTPLNQQSPEEYRQHLETAAFWQGLTTHLNQIPQGTTERMFYYHFDPHREQWNNPGNHKSGIYLQMMTALRKLGIKDPYVFIQEYNPSDPELTTTVLTVQRLIAERLTPSTADQRFENELKKYSEDEFWEKLQNDLEIFEVGAVFQSFLLHFSANNRSAKEFSEAGTRIHGDNRHILFWFVRHQERICETPELEAFSSIIEKNLLWR